MKDLRFTLSLFLMTMLEFFMEYAELLCVWVCIVVWEAYTRNSVPTEMKWRLYGGSFIVSCFWN
jgi:hypothetical protein